MSYLIKNGNTTRPLVFLLVQASDHITGLTSASPTVTISKNGGAFAAPLGAVTEIANGWYKVAANATDANANGPLLLHATAASGDPADIQFEVVAFDPEDAVRMGQTAFPNVVTGNTGAVLTSGTGTAQLNVASGKAPATLNAADVAGDVPANVLQINGSALAAKIAGLLYGSAVADGTVNSAIDQGHFTLTSSDDTLSANDNTYNNLLLVFTSGPNQFVPREITTYTGATKTVAFTGSGFKGGFPNTVTAGDSWLILSGGP